MKIKLTTDKEQYIELSDDDFNAPGWVTICLKDDDERIYVDVYLDDLYSAIKALDISHKRQLKKDV